MAASLFKPGASILNYCTEIAHRVLPGLCLLCGGRALLANLCEGCRADLPYLSRDRCPRCAAPSLDCAVCGACLQQQPHFDRVLAACAYAYPLDRLVHAFKYGGRLAVAPLLADLLLREVRDAPRPELIVPMPLSGERLRERGFNQALEIARPIAATLGIQLGVDACLRVQHAPPQSALAWAERVKNIAGAFICMEDIAGRSVAVVDDVLTTGATLNEIARVLRMRGASQVIGWVAARTLEHS
jgi:ComF family protein